NVEHALQALGGHHAASLCVTLGAAGALLLEGGTLYRSPGFRVSAVDSTGAGDVFRAGFIYARLRGDGPGQVLRFANAAAAISCTRQGALEGVPSLEEVQAVLDGGWLDGG